MAVSTQLVFGGPGTPGSSDVARYLADLSQNGRAHFQQPYSRSGHLTTAQQDLVDVFEQCSQPNWDGHGAAAIGQDTYRQAYLFLENLPAEYPMPTAGAEPDGHLTLEWYRNPRRTLSLSIGPSGDVHYSALIGPAKAYGTEAIWGEAPKPILELIGRIYAA